MAIVSTVTKLFKKFLTIGIPPEKEVLYKEVIKRKPSTKSAEALVIDDIKQAFGSAKNRVIYMVSPQKTDQKDSAPTVDTPTEENSIKALSKKPHKKTITKKKSTTKKQVTTKKSTTLSTTKDANKKKSLSKTKENTPKRSLKKSTPLTKKTSKSKQKNTTISDKKAAKIALYTKDIKKHYGEVDEAFVVIIVKNLGPSIYRKNAETVSCSNPQELDTVRRNFLIKKLHIDASKNLLDTAIKDVCEELKKARTKYRATFYYALAKKFKKESALT